MSADPAELARFIPVALELGAEPALLWGDLDRVRFGEPFFDQTIERWAGGDPPPRLVRTGLDALGPLDAAPSLDPTILIFHMSRCGSTLVSRLLATDPGTLVIAEPGPLNALLMPQPDVDAAQLLRLMVRALGRRRFGDERHYVLKLSSWNIMRFDLFRRAFPEAKLVWVQREPLEVLGSILNDPPAWLQLRHRPQLAEALFGVRPPGEDVGEFCAGALAAMLGRAREAQDKGALVLDYRDLPDAVWRRVMPFAGLTSDDAAIARMREEARFSAKDAVRRPFTRESAARRSVPEHLRRLGAELLEPLYRDLGRPKDRIDENI